MSDKSKWQQEFDTLPEWAQKLVRAAAGINGYGTGGDEQLLSGMASVEREKRSVLHLIIENDHRNEWWEGFEGLTALAAALTAPWPPPPAPEREKRVLNVVELVAEGDDDGGFDQPCAFGNRISGHAVYCHNDAWPNSPRKCHRNRDEYKHEDCPGFVANPDFERRVD